MANYLNKNWQVIKKRSEVLNELIRKQSKATIKQE
jgi:hypothetical protein